VHVSLVYLILLRHSKIVAEVLSHLSVVHAINQSERELDNAKSERQYDGPTERGKTCAIDVVYSETPNSDNSNSTSTDVVPLEIEFVSALLVTAIGFGVHCSSGTTGAMKSTLKEVSKHEISQGRYNTNTETARQQHTVFPSRSK
jgi:hypothetical protein